MRHRIIGLVLALGLGIAVAVSNSPPVVAVGPGEGIRGGEFAEFPIPRIPRIPGVCAVEELIPRMKIPPVLPKAATAAFVRKMDVTATLADFRTGNRQQQYVHRAACEVMAEIAEAESEIAYEWWAENIYASLPDSLYDEYVTNGAFQASLDNAVSYLAGRLSKLTVWNYLHDFEFKCK
jgi:hypothetical protein